MFIFSKRHINLFAHFGFKMTNEHIRYERIMQFLLLNRKVVTHPILCFLLNTTATKELEKLRTNTGLVILLRVTVRHFNRKNTHNIYLVVYGDKYGQFHFILCL